MLYTDADKPLLKAWILQRLDDKYDVDPEVFADYILTLLKHEGNEDAIRKLCEHEIIDFLGEDTVPFVDSVLRAIQYKSYVPGAPPAPNPMPAALSPAMAPAMNFYQQASSPIHESRKRSYMDFDSPSAAEPMFTGQRTYKQARRGRTGRGGRTDSLRGRNIGFGHGQMPYGPPRLESGGSPTSPFQQMLPGFDAGSPMDNIMKLQAMGFPIQQLQDFTQGRAFVGRPQYIGRKRQRCRDFDTKGFCTRKGCMFDHGNEPLFIPGSIPAPTDEYDPNDATITLTGPVQPPPSFPNAVLGQSPNGSKRRHGNEPRKRRMGRTALSAEGPVHDRTKTTIVVENIPEDSFSEKHVLGFFGQFGNIQEVVMQPYKHLAVVKFETWGQANAAYRSPKVIFDNRFVKVFWQREDAGPVMMTPVNGTSSGRDEDGRSPTSQEDSVMGQDFDMEDFLLKQAAAQKSFEEKTKRRHNVEQQRQELEQKRQQLEAERRHLRAKLAATSADDGNNESVATSHSGLDVKMGGDSDTLNDKLRAQLAALEEEAKSLGLDPGATEEHLGSSGYRGRGRGRGSYRSRYTPRGSRGGYRGGHTDVHAAYAAYSLDNRPRSVAISGVDFTEAENDEMLRQYLFGVGDFTDIKATATNATVCFADRKTAEKFFYGLATRAIPGIDGKLEPTWVNSATATPTARASPAGGAVENGAGSAVHGREEVGHAVEEQKAQGAEFSMLEMADRPADQSEMDYDVAEEGEWIA